MSIPSITWLYKSAPRTVLYSSAQKFKLKIHVKCTHESFILRNFCGSTTVADLKGRIEVVAGIPAPLQQLTFLDQSYLVNEDTLTYFDIIPDSKISLRFFEPWEAIVAACLKANMEKLKQLLPLEKEELTEWDQYSLYMAAFVIAHRGYSTILAELLKAKFDLKRKLPSGRHPLLVCVRQGHIKCTEVILGRRIRAHEWNNDRESLHDWQVQDRINANYERIKHMKHRPYQFTTRLTRAQMYDSALPTWLQGTLARRYLADILDGQPKKQKKETKIKINEEKIAVNGFVEDRNLQDVCKEDQHHTTTKFPILFGKMKN